MHDTDKVPPSGVSKRQRAVNLGLAVLAAQVGCASLIIIFFALFIGLWLDSQLGQQGLCTIGMLIVSVPFSLYVMLRIALGAINRIQAAPAEPSKEQNFE